MMAAALRCPAAEVDVHEAADFGFFGEGMSDFGADAGGFVWNGGRCRFRSGRFGFRSGRFLRVIGFDWGIVRRETRGL